MRRQLRQWWCGVTGHAGMLMFDGREMKLRCDRCGYVSPGWSLDKLIVPQTRRAQRFYRRVAEHKRGQ